MGAGLQNQEHRKRELVSAESRAFIETDSPHRLALDASIIDVTQIAFRPASVDLWHDRAAFHFFTEPAQRQAHVQTALRAIKPNAFAVRATFANDGALQCSGLPVQGDDARGLLRELGDGFILLREECEEHRTPPGNVQRF